MIGRLVAAGLALYCAALAQSARKGKFGLGPATRPRLALTAALAVFYAILAIRGGLR